MMRVTIGDFPHFGATPKQQSAAKVKLETVFLAKAKFNVLRNGTNAIK